MKYETDSQRLKGWYKSSGTHRQRPWMKSLKSLKEKGRGPRTESWWVLMGKDWVKDINQKKFIRKLGGKLRILRRKCSAESAIGEIQKMP